MKINNFKWRWPDHIWLGWWYWFEMYTQNWFVLINTRNGENNLISICTIFERLQFLENTYLMNNLYENEWGIGDPIRIALQTVYTLYLHSNSIWIWNIWIVSWLNGLKWKFNFNFSFDWKFFFWLNKIKWKYQTHTPKIKIRADFFEYNVFFSRFSSNFPLN